MDSPEQREKDETVNVRIEPHISDALRRTTELTAISAEAELFGYRQAIADVGYFLLVLVFAGSMIAYALRAQER